MGKLKSKPRFLCVTALLFFLWQFSLAAQEAVSTTTSSSSTSTSTTSGSSETSLTTEPLPPAPTGTAPTGTSTSAGAPTSGAAGATEGGPSGVGVFSRTPVQIYATISGGYDDNVNTASTNKQSSAFTSANAILDYTFGDPRLQLTLNAGAGGTYYYSHISNQDYDVDLKVALGITYKASPRLTLGSTVLVDYLTEPSFQYAGSLNSRNGNYLYTTDKIFLQYAWSRRFATKTSYSFEAFNYDKESVGVFSNRVTNTFANEFRFQMVPTTSLIAEYRYSIVSYEHEGEVIIPGTFFTPPVRIENDSMTHYVLGGIDHTFNPRLAGTFRGGAQLRSYDHDGDRTAPYFEGNVNYAVGRRTTLSWVTRYGIEEPDLLGSQSRTTLRTGFQTKFNLTSRVSTSLDAYYVHDDYHALTSGVIVTPAFSEDTFDVGPMLRYAIVGRFGLQLGYHYTNVTSDTAGREYSRNRISAGVNVTF